MRITFGSDSDRCVPNSLNYKKQEEARCNQIYKIVIGNLSKSSFSFLVALISWPRVSSEANTRHAVLAAVIIT